MSLRGRIVLKRKYFIVVSLSSIWTLYFSRFVFPTTLENNVLLGQWTASIDELYPDSLISLLHSWRCLSRSKKKNFDIDLTNPRVIQFAGSKKIEKKAQIARKETSNNKNKANRLKLSPQFVAFCFCWNFKLTTRMNALLTWFFCLFARITPWELLLLAPSSHARQKA